METLWDASRAEELIFKAVEIIDAAAAGNFDRDNIHTEAFTANVRSKAEATAASTK